MAIAVLFGGRSCEHDVSIVTGVQALSALKSYKPLPVYIDAEGRWHTGGALFTVPGVRAGKGLKSVYMSPGSDILRYRSGRAAARIDVAVLCCHGAGGEDGSLQGFLELCCVPYTGAGVLPSAVCLDKAEFKARAASLGFPVLPYASFTRREWNEDIYSVAERINAVGYPLMVKPSRQGSSIGISPAKDEAELVAAVRTALHFDNAIVAEKLLEGFRELSCAALSDGKNIEISRVEEPVGWKKFLTYRDKYAGKHAVRRRLPADIPEETEKKVREMTGKLFSAFSLAGVARVDFLLAADGELYVNEANTVPGSLAEYLFAASGMSTSEFYRRLLASARAEAEERRLLVYRFSPAQTAEK